MLANDALPECSTELLATFRISAGAFVCDSITFRASAESAIIDTALMKNDGREYRIADPFADSVLVVWISSRSCEGPPCC